MFEERVKRINELAKKKKQSGLTDEEEKEQKELYEWYLTRVKKNLTAQLDDLRIKSKDDH